MAHKKAGGSSTNGRDSQSQRLGVKLFGGQNAEIGNIILRQRGTAFRAGKNTAYGKDNTIFAIKNGIVKFGTKKIKKFTNKLEKINIVEIIEK